VDQHSDFAGFALRHNTALAAASTDVLLKTKLLRGELDRDSRCCPAVLFGASAVYIKLGLIGMSDSPDGSFIIEPAAKANRDVESYYSEFLSKLWVTKGCRFEANRRLDRKNHASQLTISTLSVYVIAGSLVTLVSPAGALQQSTLNAINLMLVITSIFILVLSNIEAGKNYALRAHVMLKCAQQLSELYNDIEFSIQTRSISPDSFGRQLKLYDRIISDFSDNHDDIDYLNYQVSHWKHFKISGASGYILTFRRRLQRFMNVWGYYLAMLLPPPLLFAAVMGKTPDWLK
jgi:hypothetical protein